MRLIATHSIFWPALYRGSSVSFLGMMLAAVLTTQASTRKKISLNCSRMEDPRSATYSQFFPVKFQFSGFSRSFSIPQFSEIFQDRKFTVVEPDSISTCHEAERMKWMWLACNLHRTPESRTKCHQPRQLSLCSSLPIAHVRQTEVF